MLEGLARSHCGLHAGAMAVTGVWTEELRAVFDRGVKAYDESGARTPFECFSEEDQAFLMSIGCPAQVLYDFVEDWCWAKEPAYDEVQGVIALRREEFLAAGGVPPARAPRPASEFPPGTAALEGISWLPRLLAKARALLRGELPPQLMYGCGGDRPFLRTYGVRLDEFLAEVRKAGTNDSAVAAFMKERGRGRV